MLLLKLQHEQQIASKHSNITTTAEQHIYCNIYTGVKDNICQVTHILVFFFTSCFISQPKAPKFPLSTSSDLTKVIGDNTVLHTFFVCCCNCGYLQKQKQKQLQSQTQVIIRFGILYHY
jgi:hypothetical protein